MPIDPSIALGVRPLQMPDPVEGYGKVLSLRNLIQQQQMAPLEMEAAKQRVEAGRRQAEAANLATKDREVWRRAFVESGGDLDKAEELGIQYGAGPESTMAFQQHKQELVNKRLTGQKEQNALDDRRDEQMRGLIDEALNLAKSNPDLYQQRFPEIAQRAITIDPRAAQRINPTKPVSVDDLTLFSLDYASRDWAAKKTEEERKAKLAGPQLRKAEAEATLAEMELAGQKPLQPVDREPKGELAEFRQAFLPGYYQSKGITAPAAKDEYDAYKAFQQTKRERVPVPGVDVPLPAAVEEQRLRMNASRAQVNGISPQQLAQVNSLAKSFDSHQTVKDYNVQVNKLDSVNRILDGGLGGPADLAVVYEFMKGLDPTSVVRESEYASASKSGNIFSGALAKFNGYLKPEGGFLPPEVKTAFRDILAKKLEASKRQVQAIHKDFARRIDNITKQQGTGADYLTNWGSLYDGPAAAPASGPKQGERKQYMGHDYVFDGSQWQLQK